ncbi:MAG: hypothetical protein M1831_001266 [Alyxoria varia]|nr:MAG: hypothetical protein M1831_001266 [Alyxoria varia]
MSERKVLQKYYPPEFDPSSIARTRKPKDAAPKLQTVRLMAPFSLQCTTCGEFIYRGRKFNARKQATDESYYNITILRFYIRCTRCSAELTFKTDPKNNDYTAEKGMKRNFEPWRESKLAEETEEERLDRLEREEAEQDAMTELENKTLDAKTEMAIADKLDEIRTRNARMERADKAAAEAAVAKKKDEIDEEKEREEREIEEAAKAAFRSGMGEWLKSAVEEVEEVIEEESATPAFVPKKRKKKQDFSAALGIKKKVAV